MNTDIDAAMDALGDPMRRRIIGRLAIGPCDVGRIAEGLPVGRTAVSMHLRILRRAGLVSDHADGNRRVYRLEPDALKRLREHLDWFWEQSLQAYQLTVEAESREDAMMTEQEILVAKTVHVQASLAKAFDAFIEMRWWPVATHHLAEPAGYQAVLEPFLGGRWYERGAGGVETEWGKVIVWQPPHRILLTWQVSPLWTYEEDPERGSEIEITFTSESPEITKVDLVHRHLNRYGPETERMRSILDAKGGEPLAAFARQFATDAMMVATAAIPSAS